VAGNTAFALNLYSNLAVNSGNLFFSPYSISTCLAMLYAGARGNTEQQMSQALRFSTNQQQFASLFGELQSDLETDQQTDAQSEDLLALCADGRGVTAKPGFDRLDLSDRCFR
jgi:serine protease inhibitor